MRAQLEDSEENSPVEQVAATVSMDDDPSQPVWTFRMWSLGLLSCITLSFLNQFFYYRTEPLIINQISMQVAALPAGRFMASVLPTRKFRLPILGRHVSLNPGPFNMKEHVLITIFANAGSAFGNGPAYAVGIVDIIRAFYRRTIPIVAAWLVVITTQMLGYGWAGLLRKYVVEPAHMWWPSTLVQVSLFRALHERDGGGWRKGLSPGKFFMIAMVCSSAYYVLPGYLFSTLSSISWVCWVWPNSVTAQQVGSGLHGLGVGAIALDWSTISSHLHSPLVSPLFTIVNVFAGYALLVYVAIPATYWIANFCNFKNFPIFSSHLFTAKGQMYDVTFIVNDKFQLDVTAYNEIGRVHMSTSFVLSYGFGFATIASTLSHVFLFYGREIRERARASKGGTTDIHTKLMQKYPDIPHWWFWTTLMVTLAVAVVASEVYKEHIQLPWWGLLLGCALASFFTLPVSIITATTNQTPGLNIFTEHIIGYIMPEKPIANVFFKAYGYVSMSQAVSFLQDFKLGHYMKIPPHSMFLVQLTGTAVAGTVNLGVAWWLLGSVKNICQTDLLPAHSPWTCPNDRVFFDASVIWGLLGPRRIFGDEGVYPQMHWFFVGGLLAPVVVWGFHKAFPQRTWIPLINLPVLLGATAYMPPGTPINYTMWVIVGIIFNFFVFRYRRGWWKRYNYVLSAGLDAGLAFMAVLLYLCLDLENISLDWWGNEGEHCPLATCPTAYGIQVDGCPTF